MRLTLAQLRKVTFPYMVEEEIDLSEDLNDFEDIVSSKPCKVKTVIKERGIDTYLVVLDIHQELEIIDSITLEKIPYVIETKAEEIYTTSTDIEDAFVIDGITLDTKEAIVTNILINKPMSVSYSDFEDDDESFDDEEDSNINPAFASLKDLL